MSKEVTNKAELDYAVNFVTALRSLEENLRDLENSQVIISGFLKAATEFYDADRAYVIEADWNENIAMNTHEWCKDGIEYQNEQLQYLEISDYSRWYSALKKNQPMIISNVELLLEDNAFEYEFFTKFGVHSLIAVPFSKRLSQGFIGVDNPKRHGADPTFLLLLACVIVQELNEIKLDKRLSAATLALKENPKGIYISCFGGLSVRGIEGVLSEDDFTSAQCYTMLAYLALIDNHRATPSRLARIIWSDECIDNPNRAVRNVAARLRTCLKVIGLDFLIIYDNGFYSLNQSMGLITDVNLFENLCLRMKQTDSAEEKYKLYESAIELFTGDLLPRLSDNINFIPNITYYHGMFVELITSYVEACLSEGQYIYAHRAVKEALTFDPYNGRLNMYLIILIYRQSGVGTAKSYYMNTKDTLSDEQLYRIKIECPALMLG